MCVLGAPKTDPGTPQRRHGGHAHGAACIERQTIERTAPGNLLARLAIVACGPLPRVAGHIETTGGAGAVGETADRTQSARGETDKTNVGATAGHLIPPRPLASVSAPRVFSPFGLGGQSLAEPLGVRRS